MRSRKWYQIPLAAIAACDVGHAAVHEKSSDLFDLLDSAKPADTRKATFDGFNKDALSGEAYAQYIVGSLYHIGDKLPGNPLPRDLDAASRYLSNAAAHGYLNAMAKMAEVKLEQRSGLEAMLWAQLYIHYKSESAPGAETKILNDGYAASLLERASTLYGGEKQKVLDNLNAFIAQHDGDIRAGMKTRSERYASGDTHSKITKMSYSAAISAMANHRDDVYAEYAVAFAPDGSASDAKLLDAGPDVALGKELRNAALRVRVNEIDANGGPRYALVPLHHTFNRYQIRK